jgi:hypothetical protein
MSSTMLRRKMVGASSIVERVNCRSLTGLELGLDVHHRSVFVILLCWKTLHTIECYSNCVQSYSLDYQCTRGLQKMFQHCGLTVPCTRTYGSDQDLGKPCIFMVLPVSGRHLVTNRFLSPMGPRDFTCHCKVSCLWVTTGHHYMTSFYLQNSISTAYTKRFPHAYDLLKLRNTLGVLRIKFGPNCEYEYPSCSFRSIHHLKKFLMYADMLS